MALIPDGPDQRPMKPVAAEQRPVRHRNASRIVIRCDERVLIVADRDPGVVGSHWYVIPGGGWDPGETSRDAAVREVNEETGLVITAQQLIGPIAHRVVSHGYSDQILVQYEDFYLLEVPEQFEPSVDGFTPEEKITLGEFRWVTADELAGLEIWPRELAELLNADGSTDRDLGEPEESTVPVALGHQGRR